MPDGNVTLMAQWTKKKYSLTYEDNIPTNAAPGASVNGKPMNQNQWDALSQVAVGSETPTLNAQGQQWTFKYWTLTAEDSGTIPMTLDASTTQVTPNADTTLTAKWTPITYTIKFNNGGGSGNQADLQFTVEDTNKALPTANEVTFTSSQNKAFMHWATQADGASITLESIILQIKNGNASSYVTGNNEITLYAVWDSVRTVIYTDGTLIINELSTASRPDATRAVYDAMLPDGSNYVFGEFSDRPLWYGSNRTLITSVEIGSDISPTSTAHWFLGMTNCTSINLTKLNTSSVTDMKGMFQDCSSLTSLDLSNFNTSSVTGMWNMFDGCSQLATIYASNYFDTVRVANSTDMFYRCYVLVGGQGTQYTPDILAKNYARIDAPGTPSTLRRSRKRICDIISE